MNTDTARMLLDTERMAPVLARLDVFEDDRPRSVELRATWVKPGRYFNAHYAVTPESGGAMPLAISAFLVDEARGSRVVAKAGAHRCTTESRRACPACNVAFLAPGILVQTFPGDYRLPTLARCLKPSRLRKASQEKFAPLGCDVVAYRPGMRCQLRYSMKDGRSVYGKVSVEKRGPGYGFGVHSSLYEALGSRTRGVRLAEPLAYLEELGLTLIAAAEGEDLSAMMREDVDGAVAAMPRVAKALGELHAVDAGDTGRTHSASSETSLLDSWVCLLTDMYPELGSRIGTCAARLAADRPEPSSQPVLLHRDFYDKQILLGPDHVTLLDMDTAGFGDPELDVANFCVHVWLRGIQHGEQESSGPLQAAFLDAYPFDLDTRRLAWYRSATLLRLAGNYVLRPRWRHVVDDLVAEAERGMDAR